MENILFVPSAWPSVPCANLPISFPYDIPYSSLYFGRWIKCRYSNSSPVPPSITAFANSHVNFIGYLLDAKFCGFIDSPTPNISSIWRSASCANDLVVPFNWVLYASISFSCTFGGVVLALYIFSIYTLCSCALCFCTLCHSVSSFFYTSAFILKISINLLSVSPSIFDCGTPPSIVFFKSFASSSIASAFVLVDMVKYL